MRTRLLIIKPAEIDSAGSSGHREIGAGMSRKTDRHIDRIHTQKRFLWSIQVIGRGAEIIIVITIGGPVVELLQAHIKVVYADILVIDGFGGAGQPLSIQLQTIFELQLVAIQCPVGVRAQEPETYLVKPILIQ